MARPQRTPRTRVRISSGDQPLEQREHGDVLDAVGRAHDREQHQSRGEVGTGGDQDQRQPPEHERQAELDGEPPALERHRPDRAEEPADADRRGQVAHLGGASVENLEDHDDDQDVQTAADERLGHDEPDHQASSRGAGDRAEPGHEHVSRPRAGWGCGELDPPVNAYAHEQGRGREQGCGAEDEHDTDVGDRDEHARRDRPEEGSEALDRRRGAVRGDQLLRGPCEGREQRLQRGPDQRGGDPDRGGQHEHQGSLARERRRSGAREGRGAEERHRQEEALSTKPVAEGGGERRDGRGRQEAHETRDPDRCRTALLVREDAEGDEMRPLRRDRGAPGELDPSNVFVPNGGGERRDQLARANHTTIQLCCAPQHKGPACLPMGRRRSRKLAAWRSRAASCSSCTTPTSSSARS